MSSKTATPLKQDFKQFFNPAKAEAAQAIVEPRKSPPTARNRKAGGRGVRISGYLPVEISEALRDEVIRRTVSERQIVSFNDVLCSILTEWHRNNQKSAA